MACSIAVVLVMGRCLCIAIVPSLQTDTIGNRLLCPAIAQLQLKPSLAAQDGIFDVESLVMRPPEEKESYRSRLNKCGMHHAACLLIACYGRQHPLCFATGGGDLTAALSAPPCRFIPPCRFEPFSSRPVPLSASHPALSQTCSQTAVRG